MSLLIRTWVGSSDCRMSLRLCLVLICVAALQTGITMNPGLANITDHRHRYEPCLSSIFIGLLSSTLFDLISSLAPILPCPTPPGPHQQYEQYEALATVPGVIPIVTDQHCPEAHGGANTHLARMKQNGSSLLRRFILNSCVQTANCYREKKEKRKKQKGLRNWHNNIMVFRWMFLVSRLAVNDSCRQSSRPSPHTLPKFLAGLSYITGLSHLPSDLCKKTP